MKVLLDTHVLIWWVKDDPILGPKSRALIADQDTEVLFSVVSCWEATIKYRLGKMDICGSDLWRGAIGERFDPIDVRSEHIVELERLPTIEGHRDPFDHLLLAQAKAEDAALMSHDWAMSKYGIKCFGVR